MDKIHAMQLFIKVAELESFSRAADFFALPKGSVSRQIQALEHQLGTQLLQRTTRRQLLTLGLLDFIKERKGHLFPELTLHLGSYGHYFSRWFTRFRGKHGLPEYHSLRHYAATTFKELLYNPLPWPLSSVVRAGDS